MKDELVTQGKGEAGLRRRVKVGGLVRSDEGREPGWEK